MVVMISFGIEKFAAACDFQSHVNPTSNRSLGALLFSPIENSVQVFPVSPYKAINGTHCHACNVTTCCGS